MAASPKRPARTRSPKAFRFTLTLSAIVSSFLFATPVARADCAITDPFCVVDEVVETVEEVADEATQGVENVIGQEVTDTTDPLVEEVVEAVDGTAETVEEAVGPVVDDVVEVVEGTLGLGEDPPIGGVEETLGTVEGALLPGESPEGRTGGVGGSGNGPGPGGGDGSRVRDAAGPVRRELGTTVGPLSGAPALASAGTPESDPTRAIQAEPFNSLGGILSELGTAAKALAFPTALTLVVAAFLLMQNRMDRRDPKLALAPVHPDVLRFE